MNENNNGRPSFSTVGRVGLEPAKQSAGRYGLEWSTAKDFGRVAAAADPCTPPPRLLCRLFGCDMVDRGPGYPDECRRCGALFYDHQQRGHLSPIVDAFRRVRWAVSDRVLRFVPRACEVCGRSYCWPLRRRRGADRYCCSRACLEDWAPF